jgi:polygalacturonase
MTVDGGTFEDVAISNITMRNVVDSPIFVRLGSRLRGPDGTKVGTIRRLSISNVTAYGATLCSIISGVPGHEIEDLTLSDIRVVHKGGGSSKDATTQPRENERAYPEPGMFGVMPAYGLFVRHARGIDISDVAMSYANGDARPPVVLDDVQDIRFDHMQAEHAGGAATMVLRKVEGLKVHQCPGLTDKSITTVDEGEIKNE